MLASLIVVALLSSNTLLAHDTLTDERANLRDLKREAITQKLDSSASGETRREEFQAKLLEIQDERKRLIVQNVALRFTDVKDKWVRNWTRTLERLSDILEKIETEFGESEATTAAEAAIADAQEHLDILADKEYQVDFESEATLRPDIKELVGEFKTDLRTTQEAIKNAKTKVQEAWTQSRPEEGEENEEE